MPGFPTAADYVERLGFGCAQIKVLVTGGGCLSADGSQMLILGAIAQTVGPQWKLETWQRGSLVSVVFVGVLIGNLMSGVIGDKLGRRLPILLSYVGMCLFSLASLFANGFYSMACLRFFVGVSFGAGVPAFYSLCSEVSPSDYRLPMNAWGQVQFAGGEFFSAFLIWYQDPFMKDLQWRWLVGLGCIPCVMFLVLALFMLEESPHFLMVNGRHSEAQRVLENFSKSNGVDIQIDLSRSSASAAARQTSMSIRERLAIVWGRHMFYSTVVLCACFFTWNFLFYGGLYAFPQALRDLELHSVNPAVNLMLGALMEAPGLFLGVVLGRYVSRKNCMLLYLLVVLMCTLIFSFSTAAVLDTSSPGGSWALESLVQIGLLGNKVFTSFGALIVSVYAAEIYPTVARTTGIALGVGFGRLGSIVAPTVFDGLFVATGSYGAFFNFAAGLCAVNAVLVLFLPYETKGTILQDHLDDQRPIISKRLSTSGKAEENP